VARKPAGARCLGENSEASERVVNTEARAVRAGEPMAKAAHAYKMATAARIGVMRALAVTGSFRVEGLCFTLQSVSMLEAKMSRPSSEVRWMMEKIFLVPLGDEDERSTSIM
jgi:hypothetical protein